MTTHRSEDGVTVELSEGVTPEEEARLLAKAKAKKGGK